MEEKVTLQGHDFFLTEEGIYETKDDFVLDEQDWLWGDFPDMCLGFRVVDGDVHPLVLAISNDYYGRISSLVYGKDGYANTSNEYTYGVSIHTDTSKPRFGGMF